MSQAQLRATQVVSLNLQALPFALPYMVLVILATGGTLGGIYIFVPFFWMVAVGDLFFGLRTTNLDPDTPREGLILYYILTWLWVPAQIATVLYVFYQALVVGHLSFLEVVAVTIMAGRTCVSGMVTAHELVHRTNKIERALGEILLSSFAFTHYRTEHVYVHHTHVGTPKDPVFAQKGQNVWFFTVRGIFLNLVECWAFERDRLRRRGLPAWHASNPFWRYVGLIAFWVGLFWVMGGMMGVVLYFSYSLLTATVLRFADYVEHYGLTRKQLPNGRYERTQPHHSWNASHRVSNWATLNVQRHSDHHAKAIRPYPLLQHYDEDVAPQLPFNYTIMMMLALIPQVWFAVMNRRVDEWRKRFYPEIENWRAYDSKLVFRRRTQFHLADEIMTLSDCLGERIEAQPQLLDVLDMPEFVNLQVPDNMGMKSDELKIARRGLVKVYYLQEFRADELVGLTLESDEIQSSMDVVDVARQWVNEKSFPLGVHVIRGDCSGEVARSTLSRVLDACLGVLLRVAVGHMEGEESKVPLRFAVVNFGELGRRQTSLNSKLCLALLFNDSQEVGLTGTSGRQNTALAKRFFELMREFSRQNLLVGELDWYGGLERRGVPKCYSFSEFESTVLESETRAGRLDLLRAHAVSGNADTVTAFRQMKQGLLSGDAARWQVRDAILKLHDGRSMDSNAKPGSPSYFWSLGNAPGGFEDQLLLEEYTQMLDEDNEPAPAASNERALEESVQLLKTVENTLRWTLAPRGQLPKAGLTGWRDALMSACDASSVESLVEMTVKARERVSSRLEQLLRVPKSAD